MAAAEKVSFSLLVSLESLTLSLSLPSLWMSWIVGDGRGEPLEPGDEFILETAESCDRPKIRRRILVGLGGISISPYVKPSQ